MSNTANKKTTMPSQKAKIRSKNFEEVALGYTKEMAIEEADRCLNCKNKPCVSACPVNVNIPEFISKIKEDKINDALDIIHQTNCLPAVCGRVCPQENQCESKCIRAIKGEAVAIGRLERFVADNAVESSAEVNAKIKNKHRVAIVGSGPSGLACAGELNKLGYNVTVFEALHKAGGVLAYGIPEFRLPKKIVEKEIDLLQRAGVEIQTNIVIGKTFTVSQLLSDGYSAVYVASGAGSPNFMGIDGENLNGVYSANEFLTRINLMKAYKKEYHTPVIRHKNIAVIGGGNVAMDAARCAKRLDADNVYVVYRRSEDEMPARREEISHAKEEGIEFKLLTNPVKIHSDEEFNVNSLECVKMKLGEPDDSGRRRPMVIDGSNEFLNVDAVIMAIGNTPNKLASEAEKDIKTNNRGCIQVDEKMQTSMKGVFAGGDAVTGAATVILAMGAGKKAAQSIHEYINEL